jgi:hypothetical protein
MLPGTVHAQYVRCGKQNCHCRNGLGHGPYFYHYWREGGRLRKRYLRSSEVDAVRNQCKANRQHRLEVAESRRSAQELVQRLRDLERP